MTYNPRYKRGDRIIGRFLIHQVFHGSMGEVYLCFDEKDKVPLALKTFQTDGIQMKRLFESEVANWIALGRHPNIVRCYWMQFFDNTAFMGLEWIGSNESKGPSLRNWMENGSITLSLALRFVIDIVRGLQHAQKQSHGIIHRDLKPENILVTQTLQAKITDFGLATNVDLAIKQSNQRTLVGSAEYMSPEQWLGSDALDFRTDIYAIGCILYELMTGNHPYKAKTVLALRHQHLKAAIPVSPTTKNVHHIIKNCLAKKAADRYSTLDSLFDDLKSLYETVTNESLHDIVADEFSADDYNNRGTTYRALGQNENAIADYNSAIFLQPNVAKIYNNRGASYADLGQYEQAIEDFNKAIELDATVAALYINRGTSYAACSQHKWAIEDYDKAISIDPDDAYAYLNRGHSYDMLQAHQRAIKNYDQAISLDPKFAQAYNNRGRSYSELGNHLQAIDNYNQALELDPHLVEAYYNRGVSYGKLGQHHEAIRNAQEALHRDNTFALAYYNCGVSLGALGNDLQAIEYYTKAIHYDPSFMDAYHNRGVSLSQLQQYHQAIEDFNWILDIEPDDAQVYYNRAHCYEKLDEYTTALADCDKAIELDNTFAHAYFKKATQLVKLGKLEESLIVYKQALDLGFERAESAIEYVSNMMAQKAFDAFKETSSVKDMQITLEQHPILSLMIPTIEGVLTDFSREEIANLKQQLAWLKQLLDEGDNTS